MGWLRELMNDPVSRKPSAVRVSAMVLTLTVTLAVWLGRDAATVAAVCGGGVVALLTRSKSDNAPPAPPTPPAGGE